VAEPPAGRTLVIGYGNDLRRDDAAGRCVAEAVERLDLPGVEVLVSTQLVPEHAERLAVVGRVVFVDASIEATGVVVSTVTAAGSPTHSHHASPAGLLALVEALGVSAPEAFLVEVPAIDLSLGEGLSDETTAAVQQAIAEVAALVTG